MAVPTIRLQVEDNVADVIFEARDAQGCPELAKAIAQTDDSLIIYVKTANPTLRQQQFAEDKNFDKGDRVSALLVKDGNLAHFDLFNRRVMPPDVKAEVDKKFAPDNQVDVNRKQRLEELHRNAGEFNFSLPEVAELTTPSELKTALTEMKKAVAELSPHVHKAEEKTRRFGFGLFGKANDNSEANKSSTIPTLRKP